MESYKRKKKRGRRRTECSGSEKKEIQRIGKEKDEKEEWGSEDEENEEVAIDVD